MQLQADSFSKRTSMAVGNSLQRLSYKGSVNSSGSEKPGFSLSLMNIDKDTAFFEEMGATHGQEAQDGFTPMVGDFENELNGIRLKNKRTTARIKMLQLLIQNEQRLAEAVRLVTEARQSTDARKGTFLGSGHSFLKGRQLKGSLVPERQLQNHGYLMEQLQRTREMEGELRDLTGEEESVAQNLAKLHVAMRNDIVSSAEAGGEQDLQAGVLPEEPAPQVQGLPEDPARHELGPGALTRPRPSSGCPSPPGSTPRRWPS